MLQYRLRAAGALLGVTDNTLRGYADNAGIVIKRASELTPGAPAVRVFEPDTLFQLAQWRRSQGYIKAPMSGSGPIIITVDIIKGGTGKTTTAVETALHLQLQSLRCLVIDLDIQANATQAMGYEPDLEPEEAEANQVSQEAIVTQTFANVLLPFLERTRGSGNTRQIDCSGIIKMPFGVHGPHLVPADTFLGDIEFALANAKGQRELYIKQLLTASMAGSIPGFSVSDYDVILFDCPPNVSFASTAALAAADIVIAPIKLDAYGFKGLTRLMSELNALEEAYKVRPDLVILPTHYAPQLARIGRMQTRLDRYRNLLAPCVISASEEFPKSLDSYLPLSLQKPTCDAVKEYKLFAEHMHAKILAKAAEKGRVAA
ncbi:ParA family protein [Chromobacterium haemolyticum]|uniref:ParA family protein n=1 Tax=Chromobacterium haemolyticum TaxID=394935 RepID=UPI00244A7585|nr:ParA family protein [Chromobacterium haemolyticum]MDH0341993.1 ParA family protein [Chromobacterium haemolyticum]